MKTMQRIHALVYPTAPTTPATVRTWMASSKATDSGDIAPFWAQAEQYEHYVQRSPETTPFVYRILLSHHDQSLLGKAVFAFLDDTKDFDMTALLWWPGLWRFRPLYRHLRQLWHLLRQLQLAKPVPSMVQRQSRHCRQCRDC